jgi:hypothetical protein
MKTLLNRPAPGGGVGYVPARGERSNNREMTMGRKLKGLAVGAMALFVWTVTAQAALVTIYSDDFSGGTGNLHGTTPDTGSANWVATATNFLANGTIGGTGAGTATLAFSPSNGLVYTLDASFNITNTTTDWMAFGFVKGQGTSSDTSNSNENRFLEGQTVGVAWLLATGDNTSSNNSAPLGDPTVSSNGGLANGSPWTGGPTDGGLIDMRIVLDTTGGTGAWTATWFAKRPADSGYTTVRSTATLLSEDITSVGFGKVGTGATGTIDSFSLTSIPEPASGLMLLGATAALGLLRKKLHG